MNWLAWIGAVPGVASLAWSLISYGTLLNRVKNTEARVTDIEREIAVLRETSQKVAVIEERTDWIKEQTREINDKLNGVTAAMLRNINSERRSFAEEKA